jgi:hypothetical protein
MRGQAEVVVRRQIDDAAAVEGGPRGLLAIEYAEVAIQTLGLERSDFVAEE